jgi:hypothetical protein
MLSVRLVFDIATLRFAEEPPPGVEIGDGSEGTHTTLAPLQERLNSDVSW